MYPTRKVIDFVWTQTGNGVRASSVAEFFNQHLGKERRFKGFSSRIGRRSSDETREVLRGLVLTISESHLRSLKSLVEEKAGKSVKLEINGRSVLGFAALVDKRFRRSERKRR